MRLALSLALVSVASRIKYCTDENFVLANKVVEKWKNHGGQFVKMNELSVWAPTSDHAEAVNFVRRMMIANRWKMK